jgi:pimeloyl-ACP methyl ester carboxylesterase
MLEHTVTAVFSEVARYLDPDSPARILARTEVANAIAAANRHGVTVVVAHSLGSVVTYETLHAYPQLHVDHLITLGSPLALPHAVFPRLSPPPCPRGTRPANTLRWSNIADKGDLVAVPPRGVGDQFDGIDHDVETAIHPIDFHLAEHYLTTDAFAETLTHPLGKPGVSA